MTRVAKSLGTILWIGLVAGTLDITENIVFNAFRGITPWRIFQFIASGLIDGRSFQLGWASVALGVVLHYTIALIWTGIFYAIARKFAVVTCRPVLSGLLYGGVVYLIMNFIVLPFSGVPQPQHAITLASRINGVLALLMCIGLTVSLLMRRTLFQARN
jgi:uncharacterized membrane protein YagU involved in acid resistance